MNFTAFTAFATQYKCGQCKKRFDEPWLLGKYPNFYPNGDLMFHWESTHGFPHEMFAEEMNKHLNSRSQDPLLDFLKSRGAKKIKDLQNI